MTSGPGSTPSPVQRWLVEHLAELIEDQVAAHAESGCYCGYGEVWQGDDLDDDAIGLVTL